MSGLILPGKDKNPAPSGGGIELPKGFSRRRSEAENTPAEPAPPAEPASPEQPEARRGRGQEFLFPPTAAQVKCPACGTPYVVPVFSVIDLGVNPELISALLGGQVNVAVCPSCGAGGPLSAPLMVHHPGHDFLGVYTPPTGMDDIQRQKLIGELTQMLMRRLPTEARRGYMLQPKQYADWQRFTEKLWEFQGVTPEMLRRQRSQTEALQSLMRLADDPKALEIALARYRELIDRPFFAIMDRLLLMASGQGDQRSAELLMHLRNNLLEMTEVGQQIKVLQDRVRALLSSIQPGATREDVLDKLVAAWQETDGREVATAAVLNLAPMLDYQFLLALTTRVEQATDAGHRAQLEELRALVMEIQDQQRQSQQAVAAQSQEVLQAVLEATDVDEALHQYADAIDEGFLGLLAGNIERAERSGATAAVRRLRQIYDKALDMLQAHMPPELQLINALVNAPDQAGVRHLLEENRATLSREFLDQLRALEEDFRGRGSAQIADRLKSVRAQAALML